MQQQTEGFGNELTSRKANGSTPLKNGAQCKRFFATSSSRRVANASKTRACD